MLISLFWSFWCFSLWKFCLALQITSVDRCSTIWGWECGEDKPMLGIDEKQKVTSGIYWATEVHKYSIYDACVVRWTLLYHVKDCEKRRSFRGSCYAMEFKLNMRGGWETKGRDTRTTRINGKMTTWMCESSTSKNNCSTKVYATCV